MGCACNKASLSDDQEDESDDPTPVAVATKLAIESSIRYHSNSQISAVLQTTRLDDVLRVTLLNNAVPVMESKDNFSITTVSRDSYREQRMITSFKRRKEYEKVSSVLAILSHKDSLTSTTINPNSVNETSEIHIPRDSVKPRGNANFIPYTNEKGYSKVLHLIHHGSLKKTNNIDHREFSYYVETNGLNGDNLNNYIENKSNDRLYTITELDFDSKRKIIKDILYAVKYFHDRNIVHRGINPKCLRFNTSIETLKKLMDRDENSDYYNKLEHCSLVLMDYAGAYCFDPSDCELICNVKKDDHDHNDYVEAKWKKTMKKHLNTNVGSPYYCSPEFAFVFAFHDHEWAKKNWDGHKNNSTQKKVVDIDIEQFTKIMRGKYDEHGYELKVKQRYDGERLFGMSWQERYKKWQNYDTLPLLENDDLNRDVWERYSCRTPRMFKASDIWSVGVIAYELVIGGVPFSGNTAGDIMEDILTKEYRINNSRPLIFRVELIIIATCMFVCLFVCLQCLANTCTSL